MWSCGSGQGVPLQYMSMRIFSAIIAALLAIFLPSNAMAQPAKPNIIVILVDDMGFSDLGCYGSEIPTPPTTWPFAIVWPTRTSARDSEP